MLKAAPALLVGLLLAGVTVLAGCGGGPEPAAAGGGVPAPPSAGGSSQAAPAAPGTTGPEGQGRLADGYAYESGAASTLVPGATLDVPFRPPAGALGALAEAGVVMPATGATTLVCDLGSEGSVALRLDAGGAWGVVQDTPAGTAELAAGQLAPGARGEPGELTALRLLCSGSPDGLAVGVSLHGAGVTFVEGATGDVPPAGPTWSVTSTGAADVRVETVLVTLVEA